MACWTDPGRLDSSKERPHLIRALKRFKFDNIIFEKGQKCRTCKIEKPARSKHCSMCGFCVEKMDHHCVWINQCVGLHNYRYFLSFLVLHGVICTYGTWVGWHILMAVVEKEHLMEMTFMTADGTKYPADKYIVFSFLNQERSYFIGVIVLCAVVACLLWLFVCWHFWLIRKGNTTNESSKTSDAGYFLERQVKFFSKWAKYRENSENFAPTKEVLEYYNVKENLTSEEIGLRWRKAEKELEIL